MSKAQLLFKRAAGFILVLGLCLPLGGVTQARAADSADFKVQEGGFYKDVFDQNLYYEGMQFLDFGRLWRMISRKKTRAANLNAYDEVPDSTFFVNRHARKRLSAAELESGRRETPGPDLSRPLTVTQGIFVKVNPAFYVRDAKGDEYLLKFDPIGYPELSTSAEVVANRFFHALGYNVPQTDIFFFAESQMVPAPDAVTYDDSGFKRPLTRERLADYLLFIPRLPDGRFRAVAIKTPAGEDKGTFHFQGRRKNDPSDPVPHELRRDLRAVQVFGSWVGYDDMRESNTQDRLTEENGQKVLKHYLMNFASALGAGEEESKTPMITHEYLFDYEEATKAYLTLGLWQKPWQKRIMEAGEKSDVSPAIGYFDNRYFDPGKFKFMLPQYVFKDLSRADAFWAAKTILAFSDDDIRAVTRAGKYTKDSDAAYVAKTLAERRDLIAKYWFEKSAPLDAFDVAGGKLVFTDLAADHKLRPSEGTVYLVDVLVQNGKKAKKIDSTEVSSPSIDLQNWLSRHESIVLRIRVKRSGSTQAGPYVLVELNTGGIVRIEHQD